MRWLGLHVTSLALERLLELGLDHGRSPAKVSGDQGDSDGSALAVTTIRRHCNGSELGLLVALYVDVPVLVATGHLGNMSVRSLHCRRNTSCLLHVEAIVDTIGDVVGVAAPAPEELVVGDVVDELESGFVHLLADLGGHGGQTCELS